MVCVCSILLFCNIKNWIGKGFTELERTRPVPYNIKLLIMSVFLVLWNWKWDWEEIFFICNAYYSYSAMQCSIVVCLVLLFFCVYSFFFFLLPNFLNFIIQLFYYVFQSHFIFNFIRGWNTCWGMKLFLSVGFLIDFFEEILLLWDLSLYIFMYSVTWCFF